MCYAHRVMSTRTLVCFGLLCLVFHLPSNLVARAQVDAGSPGDTITLSEIRLQGVRVWSGSDLRELIRETGLQTGTAMDRQTLERRVDAAIERLLAEGLFSDIQAQLSGDALVFQFEEHPRLIRLEYEGNSAFDVSKLNDVILLQEGDAATDQNIRSARRELENFYHLRGYRDARVRTRVSREGNGRSAVTFVIDEGTQEVISDVYVEYVGGKNPFAQVAQNWSLKSAIPLGEGDPYSPQNIRRARQAIQNWYRRRGRLDVRVEEEPVYNTRKEGVEVTFRIAEGPVYYLRNVTFENNQVFSDTALRPMIPLQRGDVFDNQAFLEGLRTVEHRYNDRGYANAVVFDPNRFRLEKDDSERTVDVTVNVKEGNPFYVEKIEIHGNRVTYNKVIRREIGLEPGELLEGEKKRNSLRRLRNLGFFKEVEMNLDPGSRDNTKIVRVRVQEARTGQLQIGGGYSSSTGFLGQLSVRKDNFSLWDPYAGFTGRGQSVELSARVGDQRNNFSLTWDEPWFNDDLDEPGPSPEIPLAFGFSAFDQTFDRLEGYDEGRTGGSLRLGREFGAARSNKIDLQYSFRNLTVDDLSNVNNLDNVPDDIELEAQNSGDTDGFDRSIGSLRLGLQRDRRDNRLWTQAGYFIRGSTELAGEFFGGDSSFYFPEFEFRGYLPFWGPTTWATRANYRTIDTWEDQSGDKPPIPSTEKFFLGGFRDVRGYEFRDLAIYDDQGNKISGGSSAWYTNLEYRFELVEKTAHFYVFGDVGQVSTEAWELEANNLKRSAGVGLRVRSPIGPINLSWAQRLDNTFPGADDEGETQVDFDIGRGF